MRIQWRLQYHNKENWNDAYNNKQGDKALQCEHQWRRWLRRLRGASQHALTCMHSFTAFDNDHTSHSMAQVLSAFHLHPWSSTCCLLFDSTLSALYFFLFLLSVPVFLFHLELFPELLYTKDMAKLRRSATNESEDTYDVFHPPTTFLSFQSFVWKLRFLSKTNHLFIYFFLLFHFSFLF